MAKIKEDHQEPHTPYSDHLPSTKRSTDLFKELVAMKYIEKNTEKAGFLSEDTFKIYMQAYCKSQEILLEERKHEERIKLCEKVISFLQTTNKWKDKLSLLSIYITYVNVPLQLQNKNESKKILLACKKVYDEIEMNSLSLKDQWTSKYMMYSSYFKYYTIAPINASEIVLNGVLMLNCAVKSDVLTSTVFLMKLSEVINETTKVRAFRQSNYLLRAFKSFYDAYKNDPKKDFALEAINSGKLPCLLCTHKLCHVKLMLKILMTMKERAIAEKKLGQRKILSDTQKNCPKILEDCHIFGCIEVPTGDAILDGLLKNEDEIKFVYRRIQEKMKTVKDSNHENLKNESDRCMTDLKNVKKFFKIKN